MAVWGCVRDVCAWLCCCVRVMLGLCVLGVCLCEVHVRAMWLDVWLCGAVSGLCVLGVCLCEGHVRVVCGCLHGCVGGHEGHV